jgi:hypothetical protein
MLALLTLEDCESKPRDDAAIFSEIFQPGYQEYIDLLGRGEGGIFCGMLIPGLQAVIYWTRALDQTAFVFAHDSPTWPLAAG